MKRRARRQSGGFTLVEVMVALIIVVAALITISEAMGRMLLNATTLRDRTYASWIAQNRIVEMRASGTIPEVGTSDGEVDYALGRWAWEANVSETGVENLMRVDVTVRRPDSEDRIRTVTGFIGEPAIPGLANSLWSQRGDDEGARN